MPDTTGTTRHSHPATAATAGRWALDPARSSVDFRCGSFWGLETVKGSFKELAGEGEVLAGGGAQGTLTIQAASVDTAHERRDAHLRADDFFDAEAHPQVVFTARSVSPAGSDSVEVAGDLTIRGITHPLTFTARITDATPEGATLNAEVRISRSKYGMTWNKWGMVKDFATIVVVARFVHQG
jgi:polyisoprenoid-binding protein YceI